MYAPATGLLLPLTLSFYAFQAVTYTLDVYHRDSQPIASYLTFLTSVTFFPTEDGGRALFLIALGLIKKFLIADYLGNNLVNRVFDLPTLYSGGDVLVR